MLWKKLFKKFILVSDVQNLETDDRAQMFTITNGKIWRKMKIRQNSF